MYKRQLPLLPFLRGVAEEMRKVVWPTRDQIISHTLMVIISVVIATLIFASIDFGLRRLVILAINR